MIFKIKILNVYIIYCFVCTKFGWWDFIQLLNGLQLVILWLIISRFDCSLSFSTGVNFDFSTGAADSLSESCCCCIYSKQANILPYILPRMLICIKLQFKNSSTLQVINITLKCTCSFIFKRWVAQLGGLFGLKWCWWFLRECVPGLWLVAFCWWLR